MVRRSKLHRKDPFLTQRQRVMLKVPTATGRLAVENKVGSTGLLLLASPLPQRRKQLCRKRDVESCQRKGNIPCPFSP